MQQREIDRLHVVVDSIETVATPHYSRAVSKNPSHVLADQNNRTAAVQTSSGACELQQTDS
jgi:hypothetical protein